jgi:hypothetical protein
MGGISSTVSAPVLSSGTTSGVSDMNGGNSNGGTAPRAFKMVASGSATFRMTLSAASSQVITGQIFKNGSAVGTLRTMSSGVEQTYDEALSFNSGDVFTLVLTSAGGALLFYSLHLRGSTIPSQVPTFITVNP